MSKIIVSLTTTSSRVDLCRSTILSIVTQKKRPDAVVVWISKEPYLRDNGITDSHIHEQLTQGLSNQNKSIVKCYYCSNTGPYRKLIPALKSLNKEDIVVTCDDDIFYGKNWLSLLLKDFVPENKTIHASRVRSIKKNFLGKPTGYIFWPLLTTKTIITKNWLVTYGGGAVLCVGWFQERLVNDDSYLHLAPTSDDIWYSKMCQLSDLQVLVIPEALSELNFFHHNDGLVLYNVPQGKSLLSKVKKVLFYYPMNYFLIKKYGNDIAYKRIDNHFDNLLLKNKRIVK